MASRSDDYRRRFCGELRRCALRRRASDYLTIVYDDGALFGLSWPTLSHELMRALIEAAHAHDRLAVVHVSTARAAIEALDAGADGLVHLFTDESPTDELIEVARGHGAFVVPTMVVLKSISGTGGGASLVDDPRIDPYLAPASRAGLSRAFPTHGDAEARFAIPRETVQRLHAVGVPVLAGTDAPNPDTSHRAAIHHELELLVEAGLSPLDALRAATSLPARHFGLAPPRTSSRSARMPAAIRPRSASDGGPCAGRAGSRRDLGLRGR